MKKSVIVIKTPNNCKECPVNRCKNWVDDETRPKECELRPLPQRETGNIYSFEGYSNGFAAGYNKCLADITGNDPIPVISQKQALE